MRKWYPGFVAQYNKDPSDVFDVPLDFTQLLQADTIDTATITGTNLTIDSSSTTNNIVTVWISAGSNCTTGTIKATITTTGGRTFERSVDIEIKDL